MKTHVDPDPCIGCELCVSICPEVYEMADEKARAKVDVVPVDREDAVREAASSCPAEAIAVEA